MNRLPIFHDEKNFRDRSEQMFRDMQLKMDHDFMRGFGRPLGSSMAWGPPSSGPWFGGAPSEQLDKEFFQLKPMHIPQPPSFEQQHGIGAPSFPAPMEVLDAKTVDNLFLEDPEHKSRLFQMSFDVKDYDPQAIQVRVEDNCLIVEAKQTEVKEGGTKLAKEFSRKIQLPAEVEPEKLTSTLSTDGVLSVKAPVPPRYHNVIQGPLQAAPSVGPQTFTTTFKTLPAVYSQPQQPQQQFHSPPIQDFHTFPSHATMATHPSAPISGCYTVPVLAADASALNVRDRPVFSPLGDGSGRRRMDLLLDLGRQYTADNVVVKFDDRSRMLTVEATKEERDPNSGKTSRCQTQRQFELGERVDLGTLQAVMKGEGQLHVIALTCLS